MAQATNPKIEELRQRLDADPKSRLFYQLGEELRRASEFGEAERVLRTGLAVYPAYLAAWVSLGRVLREQKKDRDAVEALNKALQLDPSNVVAARLLADAFLALGENTEALKKYKLVHALIPADEALRTVIDRLEREVDGRPAPASLTPEPIAAEAVHSPPLESNQDRFPSADAELPFTEPDSLFESGDARPLEPAPFESAGEDLFESSAPEPMPETGAFDAGAAPADDEAVDRGEVAAVEEDPFDDPFARGENLASQRVQTEAEAADDEPMFAAHDESPFEEPVSGFTSAALEIEAPSGFHVDPAPDPAEIAAPLDADTAADSAEPFPATTEGATSEDVSHTLTMAELYEKQGLAADAREIYHDILSREPDNREAQARLDASARDPRVQRLTAWLSKVSRKEVGGV